MSCRRTDSCVDESQPLADRRRVGLRRQDRRESAQRIGFFLARGQGAQPRAAGIFGQPVIEHAGLEHGVEGIGSSRRVEGAQQLLARPARLTSPAHRRGVAPAGVEARAMERRPAEARMEAEETQHAQAILGDALLGIADEAHATGQKVGLAVEVVVDGAVAARRRAR